MPADPSSVSRRRLVPGLLTVALVMPMLLGCSRKPGKKLYLYCGAGIRPPVAEMAEHFGEEE